MASSGCAPTAARAVGDGGAGAAPRVDFLRVELPVPAAETRVREPAYYSVIRINTRQAGYDADGFGRKILCMSRTIQSHHHQRDHAYGKTQNKLNQMTPIP